MVKIMENPIKMDDLGGKPTIFGNTHMLNDDTKLVWPGAEWYGRVTRSTGRKTQDCREQPQDDAPSQVFQFWCMFSFNFLDMFLVM